MDYLKKSKFFYLIILLLSSLILWENIKEIRVFVTIFTITVNTLLLPSIFSLFIYYLLRPFYLLLVKHSKRETLSLILTLLLFLFLFTFLVREFIPLLIFQIDTLITNVPQLIQELDQWIIDNHLLDGQDLMHYLGLINDSFTNLVDILFVGLRSSTNFLFVFVSSSFLIVSIVPIMVIYLLKNTNKPKSFYKKFPVRYQKWALNYFSSIEKTLSDYISGKAIVCFYVFLGTLLTFTVAGLKGALLFAVVAGIMDIIPYFGPWIGAIPAILSASISQDANIIIIIIGIIIIQLGESYVVSPYIMSKELKLHPLFVIIVMLITGQAFGLIGMVIILPIMAALKVTFQYMITFRQLLKEDKVEDEIL